MAGFEDVVKGAASDFVGHPDWSKFVVFKNKLKFIKNKIRSWNAESKAASQISTSHLLGRLVDIDKSIDDGHSSGDLIRERRGILGDLASLEKVRSLDVAQKVRSTWAMEGDEDFAFFHALLKKKDVS